MQKLYAKKMFEEIPFNDLIEADDWDLIEGVNKPERGADETSKNAQNVDWLTDAGLMAKENAVEKAKLGTTILDGGYFKTGFVDADRVDTGILVVARTEAKCTNANADQTSINIAADTAKVQGETIISGGYIKSDYLTATNVVTGTLTGLTVQTASDGARVILDGSNNRISIRDASRERIRIGNQYIYFYNSASVHVGSLYTDANNYLTLYAPTNLKIRNNHSSYYILFDIVTTNIAYIYTGGLVIASGKKLTTPEVAATYVTGVNTVRFVSTASPLTDNGSIYFNGSHFYGRIGGSWVQLDN